MTPDTRAIDRIAQVLASTGAPGTFATRRTVSADELRLNVVGVGPIPLPLSPASARRLCGIAHPARYGLRDQTLLDRNVRDAWEIGKRQVKIDARRWRRTLDPELEHIARDLGLPEGHALRAELHNLLVVESWPRRRACHAPASTAVCVRSCSALHTRSARARCRGR